MKYLILILILFVEINIGSRLINSGNLFSELKDYYIPENLNYYSGGYSEQYCKDSSYITVPLGVTGGLDEGSLSSFLLTKKGSSLFIGLDAGTVWQGVRRLTMLQDFNTVFNITYPPWATLPEQRATWFIKNHIQGYLIGHSHLDHVGGLIVESAEDQLSPKKNEIEVGQPEIYKGCIEMLHKMGYISDFANITSIPDQKKPIIGISDTLYSMANDLFNGYVWPNLPMYGRYSYFYLGNGNQYSFKDLTPYADKYTSKVQNEFPFNHFVKSFEICHDSLISTAFILTDSISGEQIVFFSDTGISTFKCDWEYKILQVWRNVKIDKLKAVYLESSFTNDVADNVLFGHLRPKDIMKLMDSLLENSIQTSPPKTNLKHVKLIIEHIKPQVGINQYYLTSQRMVYQQLQEINNHGVKVIIPNQGVPICF
ncbi:hypothetical protein ACTFIV_008878 [Dictyostelium citrinum]